MKIGLFGDVHGKLDVLKSRVEAARRFHHIDAAIQVGDLGLFPSVVEAFRDAGNEFIVPVYAIDGNHEDHRWLRRCVDQEEATSWRGWGLHYQQRASVAHLDGATIGFLGGALHADRPQSGSTAKRTTNWLTDKDLGQALDQFDATPPDLIISHSCPYGIGIGMRGRADLIPSIARHVTQRGFNSGPIDDCGEKGLRVLWHCLIKVPRVWVFGHFHVHHHAVIDDSEFYCVGTCDGSTSDRDNFTYVYDTRTQNVEVHMHPDTVGNSDRSGNE